MEIIRDRLLERVCRKQITLIQAPIGFGKSTLIRQFLDKYKHIKQIYLPLHSFDELYHQFINNLLSELRNKLGERHFLESRAIMQTDDYSPELLGDRFFKELAEVEEPLLFVFDGLEVLSRESIVFLRDLIRYSTEENFYIFSSRKSVEGLATELSRSSMELLGSKNLSFSTDEILKVFDESINRDEATIIKEEMGGWPFGISLIYSLWNEDLEIKEISNLGWSKYTEIFKETVFEPLSWEIKEFLLKTNLLEIFTPDIIEYVWGVDGEKLLEETLKKQLFIFGDDVYGYQYHKLFSRYLSQITEQMLSDNVLSKFYSEIGNYYYDNNDVYNGLIYKILSKDNYSINESVENSLDDIINLSGQQLNRIVKLTQFAGEDVGILYLRFVKHFRNSELEKAKYCLNLCMDIDCENHLNIKSAVIYYLTYINCVFGEKDENLEEFFKDIPDLYSDNTYILNAQGFRHYIDGEFEKGIEKVKLAIKYAEAEERKNWTALLYDNISTLLLRQNDLKRALEYAEKGLNLLSENNTARIILLERMINISLNLNSINETEKYAEEIEQIKRFSTLFHSYLIYKSLGDFALEQKKYKQAKDYYRRTIELTQIHRSQKETYYGIPQLCLLDAITNEGKNIPSIMDEFNLSTDPLELLKTTDGVWDGVIIYNILQSSLKDETIEDMLGITQKSNQVKSEKFLRFILSIYNEEDGIIRSISESELEEEDFEVRITKRFFYNYTRGKTRLPIYDEELTIRVCFIGGFRFRIGDVEISERDWKYRKAMETLAFMIKHRKEEFTSERLVSQIWPEAPLKQGRDRLKVAISEVRKSLKDTGIANAIVYSSGVYYISEDLNFWVDVEEIDYYIELARTAKREDDLAKAFEYFSEAESLLKGEFLPNLYDEWSMRYFNYYNILRIDLYEQLCELSKKLNRRDDYTKYSARLMMITGEEE